MANRSGRRKHVPQRTCVGCRQTAGKRQLMRLVRTPEGIVVDPTGKLPGRGAYVHDDETCWQTALAGSLASALKTKLEPEAREALLHALKSGTMARRNQ